MFNLRRRTSSSYSSSYYGSRKKKQRIPKLWIIAAIPLGILALEILLRMGTSILGKSDELTAYVGEPEIAANYHLKPLNQAGQSMQGISGHGSLAIQETPLTGFKLVGNQKNDAVQINAQGFRSGDAVNLTKPKNEVRIFVLGGSSAFGQFNSSNQSTFATLLEARLNQQVQEQKSNTKKFRPDVLPYYADELEKALKLPPKIRDGQYRVINAAVPGYTSGNTLTQVASQILAYQPDVLVVMNGYGDLLLPSSQEAASIEVTDRLLSDASGHFIASLSQGMGDFFSSLYLVKSVQYWLLKPQSSIEQLVDPLSSSTQGLGDRLAAKPEELNLRVDRYGKYLLQLARLSGASKASLVVALQPEVTQRESLTTKEKQLVDRLGSNYQQRVQAGYQQLQKTVEQVNKQVPGLTTAKLQDALNQVQGDAFQDPIHLTDSANQAIADRLYDTIVTQLQVQPKPFTGGQP
ncbi:SGNH/GDSL hydrolase family protein [Alkalinema sp. FACHB-956]|uniref:SGNH/GDSL hydrolase family protein n=1 Tax=Alkalinema sp. FACHB-956 TaxID=2692768 RepID=UPI001F554A44|nr:SGNH/GDSL hydrolase family protein [Alkalinema sp. FACHB-956]